jgi:hypothetical protein
MPVIWLAARLSPRARMIGMPPATAASKQTTRPARRAASNSSNPCAASSALFAVTTCLPAASAASTTSFATVVPPISSTTMCTAGSVTAVRQSVPTAAPGTATSRGFVRSRTTRWRRTRERPPARAVMRSACSVRIRATPVPTVPQPTIAIPSVSAISFVLDDGSDTELRTSNELISGWSRVSNSRLETRVASFKCESWVPGCES